MYTHLNDTTFSTLAATYTTTQTQI